MTKKILTLIATLAIVGLSGCTTAQPQVRKQLPPHTVGIPHAIPNATTTVNGVRVTGELRRYRNDAWIRTRTGRMIFIYTYPSSWWRNLIAKVNQAYAQRVKAQRSVYRAPARTTYRTYYRRSTGYAVTCRDGWVSYSGGKQGACSSHGGVR